MTLKERIVTLCKQNNIPVSKLEKELGFAGGYISKLDKSTPNSAKLQKIAGFFGVTLDYLMTGKDSVSNSSEKSVELTARDRRDIGKALDEIMSEIEGGEDGPLYYNGIEVNSESVGFLKKAIEFALTETKKENKVKYNPNKNKK